MSFRRGGVYYFDDETEAGIIDVPVGYVVTIRSTREQYLLINRTGLVPSSTIAFAISNSNLDRISGGSTLEPVLSSNSISINEGDSSTLTIADYEPSLDYTIESLDPLVTASIVGDTITISAGSISGGTDEQVTVRINAKLPGVAVSDWVPITVNVIRISIISDDAFQVTDFTGEANENDGYNLI